MPVGSLHNDWPDPWSTSPGRRSEPCCCTGPIWSGRRPDRYSAHDLVVVVEQYVETYRELRRRGFTHRPPRLMASLAWLLPPNVIAYSPEGADGPMAKCLIISARDFERELSDRPRDHFMISRMIQEVGVLYVRDAAAERWLGDCLEAARRTVLDWAAPYVTAPFSAETLTREMIAICYRSEIRPESGSRASSVFEAQRAYLVDTYEKLLADASSEGLVVRGRAGIPLRAPTGADGSAQKIRVLQPQQAQGNRSVAQACADLRKLAPVPGTQGGAPNGDEGRVDRFRDALARHFYMASCVSCAS